MFVVTIGLSVLAAVLLFVANRRFDMTAPTWRHRLIAILISLGIMVAVYLATVSVTGRASVVMIPVGLIAVALVDLALTEAFRRRT